MLHRAQDEEQAPTALSGGELALLGQLDEELGRRVRVEDGELVREGLADVPVRLVDVLVESHDRRQVVDAESPALERCKCARVVKRLEELVHLRARDRQ